MALAQSRVHTHPAQESLMPRRRKLLGVRGKHTIPKMPEDGGTIGATQEGSGEKATAKQNPCMTLHGSALSNWPPLIKLPDPERRSLSVCLWKLCCMCLSMLQLKPNRSVFLFHGS